ncbi:MAG: hypothetical protein J5833_02910 [Victivallales bacterium]|nr:hypothetical protein [Victivallales bacterium]
MKIRVFICALLVGTLAMADELLSETAKTYEWMGKPGYSVKMMSPELGLLVSQTIQAKAQQMGMPMANLKISHFELKSEAGGLSAKVGLDIPDERTRTQMEANLNQMITTMGFSKVMAESSIGAIVKIAEHIKNHADSFTQTEESTEQVAQYSCADPSMLLLGTQKVSKILINVNKQYKIIPAIRFDFSDGTAILIQFAHNVIEGKTCPVRMVMRHTLKQAPNGVKLPAAVSAFFDGYKFQ